MFLLIETQLKKEIIPGVYDFVFKELVHDENCREWLAEIISDVTGIDYNTLVKNIVIKDSKLRVNSRNEKKNIADIVLEVDNNYINIEMNNFYYQGLTMRNNAYHASILKEVYKKDSDYLDINKVIQINFNNFNTNKSKNIVDKFMIINVETKEIENEIYEKYYINLPNVKNICYDKDNKKLTRLQRNLMLLVEKDIEKLRDISRGEEKLEKVVDKLEDLSEDDFIIGMWDYEADRKRIERTKIRGAEIKATEKGLKKGLKRGIEQGIKQGIQQGIDQGVKNTALNMLQKKIDISLISECTGLSIEEINSLK